MPRTRLRKINPGKAFVFDGSPEDIIRFHEMVDEHPVTCCWLWKGYRDPNGYGQFKFKGRAEWAHRVGYAIRNKEGIPAGMEVDHTDACTSASCVNPEHLRLKTQLENATDGGHRRHRAHARAKEKVA